MGEVVSSDLWMRRLYVYSSTDNRAITVKLSNGNTSIITLGAGVSAEMVIVVDDKPKEISDISIVDICARTCQHEFGTTNHSLSLGPAKAICVKCGFMPGCRQGE